MSIGGGIFLMAVGAILAFAVQDSWPVIDLTMIGYIMMGAGFLITVLGLILATRKKKAVSTTQTVNGPNGEGIVKNERSIS